jgi:hypothetical protein
MKKLRYMVFKDNIWFKEITGRRDKMYSGEGFVSYTPHKILLS